MSISVDDQRLSALVRKIDPGAKLLRAWQLTGGISAQMVALEVEQGNGAINKWVARWHWSVDPQDNPHIPAADEFRLLRTLVAAGLPVPAAVDYDASGEILANPYLVLEYVEGAAEFAPADLPDYLRQFTETLAKIHHIDGATADLSFLPMQDSPHAKKSRRRPEALDESLDEGRIRAALETARNLPGRNPPGLLHGDYWPGNLVWRDGQLVAVIDWEDAQIGDPLSDLGSSRLDILWEFGSDAMHSFTKQYQALQPTLDYGRLPYWDLIASLRPMHSIGEWAGSPERERHMREGHAQFVAQAFAALESI
jgi:aminoglycoside phosphotransferase (APT) family kinase protein